MASRNIELSMAFDGDDWWHGEVQDNTGRWFPIDGIWARTKEDAAVRFAQIAGMWSQYRHDTMHAQELLDEIQRGGSA